MNVRLLTILWIISNKSRFINKKIVKTRNKEWSLALDFDSSKVTVPLKKNDSNVESAVNKDAHSGEHMQLLTRPHSLKS